MLITLSDEEKTESEGEDNTAEVLKKLGLSIKEDEDLESAMPVADIMPTNTGSSPKGDKLEEKASQEDVDGQWACAVCTL